MLRKAGITRDLFFSGLVLQINMTAMKIEVLSRPPCAACKIRRKKCTDKCVFKPYFPQSDAHKFQWVHTIFGYGHAKKLLQGLLAEKRSDAVSSMVYEARERINNPVHGCLRVVNDLNKRISELESRLASREAALDDLTLQRANLLNLVIGNDPKFYSEDACWQENRDPNFFNEDVCWQENIYTHPKPLVEDSLDHFRLWAPFCH